MMKTGSRHIVEYAPFAVAPPTSISSWQAVHDAAADAGLRVLTTEAG